MSRVCRRRWVRWRPGWSLGGNRLSGQVDAMILPFRESFAAVFFVGLGTLLRPAIFPRTAVVVAGRFARCAGDQNLAGGVALRCTGLNWSVALGMGLGLAQMGEFSFVLFSEAMRQGLISSQDYNRMLFIALGTLIATPELLRLGLRCSSSVPPAGHWTSMRRMSRLEYRCRRLSSLAAAGWDVMRRKNCGNGDVKFV